MKNTILIILCFMCCAFYGPLAQNTNTFSTTNSGTVRAVVVGISNYKNEKIPDLKYAHKDAEAFAGWLQSAAGPGVSAENIQVLINEKATTGQMVAALGWLVESSKPGDKAIIYFSGHGDVERISKFQRGYLLTYDSPPNNYMAGAFPVYGGLDDIIATLSEADVEVLMISDACRAGKLAGSSVGGTQATSAVIAKQFANEVKILSCQPDEFSLEGEDWGGGRGCFSFHLLDGLYGMADSNEDLKVNLRELERYLEDHVTAEAAPHSQVPMTIGKNMTQLAYVDEALLAEIKSNKKGQPTSLSKIASKGFEELILAQADSSIQELYQQFLSAIESGNLMEPEGESANDYYAVLSKESSLEQMHGYMRRNFAAALQDESQEALQDYFYDTEKYYAEYFHTDKKSVKNFAKYLERAAELLGKDHYMYNSLKSRQLYFHCFNLKENSKDLSPDSIRALKISLLNKALEYDDEAAYVYKGLADIYSYDDTLKKIEYYEKAIDLAPDWAILYIDLIIFYRGLTNFDKAIYYSNKALELDSSMVIIYQWLAYTYANSGQWEKKRAADFKSIELIEKIIAETPAENVFPYYYYQLGEAYWASGVDYIRAEKMLKIALEKTGDNFPRIHTLLGSIYSYLNKPKEAEREFFMAIEKYKASKSEPYSYLARLYETRMKDNKKAEEYYLKSIGEHQPNEKALMASGYSRLGRFYLYKLKDQEKALKALNKSIELNSSPSISYTILGDIYKERGDDEMVISTYQKGIKNSTAPELLTLKLVTYYLDRQQLDKAEPLFSSLIGYSFTKSTEVYELANAYLKFKNEKAFEETIQRGIRKFPDSRLLFYNNSCLYALANQQKEAITHLEISIKKGFKNYEWMQKDKDLDNIRNIPEFKALMEKYFPEKD